MSSETSPYSQMGGAEFFEALVGHFYEGVASDPVLRAMYPDDDLGPAERRLLLFLTQYWGGPTTYSDERGHPRLRMRHNPYVIDDAARDRWLTHMRAALDLTMAEQELDPAWEQELWRYLVGAAIAMVNAAPADNPAGLTMHQEPQ
ncbi:MAG TPA: globin [Candidatus Nanopelagicales bacterium]